MVVHTDALLPVARQFFLDLAVACSGTMPTFCTALREAVSNGRVFELPTLTKHQASVAGLTLNSVADDLEELLAKAKTADDRAAFGQALVVVLGLEACCIELLGAIRHSARAASC